MKLKTAFNSLLLPTALLCVSPAKADDSVGEVRVVGDKNDSLQRTPGSGFIIAPKEVERAQPTQTGELLRRVPGVHVRAEDSAGLRLNVGIRGLDSTRSRLVLMNEDGVPLAVGPYADPVLFYTTPLERISSVEVLKGSGGILNGPQTVGGVINFLTLPAPDHEEIKLDAQYGERNYQRYLARYGNASGDTRYVLQVVHKRGDGIRDQAFEATDIFGKVAIRTGEGGEALIRAGVYHEWSRSTYVGLTRPLLEQSLRTNTVAPDDYFTIRRYDLSVTHEQRISQDTKLRTLLYGYVTDRPWQRQLYDRERQPNVSYARVLGPEQVAGDTLYFRPGSLIRDRMYRVAGIEPRLEHRFETGSIRHTLTSGVRLHVEDAKLDESLTASTQSKGGTLQSRDLYETIALSAHALDRIAFRDNLIVSPGIRVEQAFYRRTNARLAATDSNIHGSSNITAIIPGVGITYGTPMVHAFGGIHAGFSPPRLAQSITPQGRDTRLASERNVQWEVGIRAREGVLRAEATGFVMSFQNQIISGTLASGIASELVNGGHTLHRGVETALGVGGDALGRFELDLSVRYTLSRATFMSGVNEGKVLPYAPLHTAAIVFDLEDRSGFGGETSYSFVSEQFADAANTVETDATGRLGRLPGYHVLDLSAFYKHRPTSLTFSLIAKSVLDEVYVSGRLPDGAFTAGFRQIIGGIRWQH